MFWIPLPAMQILCIPSFLLNSLIAINGGKGTQISMGAKTFVMEQYRTGLNFFGNFTFIPGKHK